MYVSSCGELETYVAHFSYKLLDFSYVSRYTQRIGHVSLVYELLSCHGHFLYIYNGMSIKKGTSS